MCRLGVCHDSDIIFGTWMISYTNKKQLLAKGGEYQETLGVLPFLTSYFVPWIFREQNRSRRYCARRADLRQKERVHTALNLLHLQDAKTKHRHGILRPGFKAEVWHTDTDCIQISKFGRQFSLTLKVCWDSCFFPSLFLRLWFLQFRLKWVASRDGCSCPPLCILVCRLPTARTLGEASWTKSCWAGDILLCLSIRAKCKGPQECPLAGSWSLGTESILLPFNFFGIFFCGKGAIVGWQ